ncbi:KAP family P-loop NTPase fold protein [Tritonibacter mobilis]|uniref:KAP family P-loop NTPase fold protein n=1 Tax=Tritonibacter mobilis TaxID=379347 RepID=UPI001C090221|nr:P-loop NTPase fold protein [Tritonibacter mobilis]MBU3034012.1 KAP family NTPase [Tritonibacter mobilis]WHQ85053.1 P-loop NTPase fold protein [Tritonibacter mobilis]
MALNANEEPEVAWEGDTLGYKEVGETFTTLVKSVKDDTKVISIEAGYGRGKTFFRKHWAEHLRQQDEVVIEIDAHLSDHSGDPVLTFIGALVDALPEGETSTGKKLVEKGRKYGGLALRTVLRVGLRQGAEEIFDAMTGKAVDALGESNKALKDATKEFGDGLSEAAGDLVVSQIAAERMRTEAFPAQMSALRDALTGESEESRVIVMVDELDRCHPDYAIAFLEAMKLVFAHDGFVFCLFVNDEYLEGLAAHRFGAMKAGERYLDKFIDIRLKLPDTKDVIAGAAEELFKGLKAVKHPLPFGEGDEFTIARAARLAGELAPLSELSMRQIERVKLRVELALRCYPEQPLDYALLVWLAFRDACNVKGKEGAEVSGKALPISDRLPRSQLIPELAAEFSGKLKAAGGVSVRGFSNDPLVEQELIHKQYRERIQRAQKLLSDQFSGLGNLPSARFRCSSSRSQDWERVLLDLALYYIPEHENVLNALHRLEVAPEDNA